MFWIVVELQGPFDTAMAVDRLGNIDCLAID
jgi:hypothetical protein